MADTYVRRHRLELWLRHLESHAAERISDGHESTDVSAVGGALQVEESSNSVAADLTWVLAQTPRGRGKRTTVGAVSISQKLVDGAALRCRHWMRLHRDRVNFLCDMGLEYIPANLVLHEEGFLMLDTNDSTFEKVQDGIPLTALMAEALQFYGETKIDGDVMVFSDDTI